MKINYWYKRDRQGKFDSFKEKVRRFVRSTIRVSAFSSLLLLSFVIGAATYSTSRVEANYNTIDAMPAKVEALKSDLVDRLAKQCETKGLTEADGAITFDTNNQASIGSLQFQIKTVQYYEKVLHDRSITRKEAILIALDDAKASALANEVIFETEKGLSNWLNCANKLGLRAEVDVIKKLSK